MPPPPPVAHMHGVSLAQRFDQAAADAVFHPFDNPSTHQAPQRHTNHTHASSSSALLRPKSQDALGESPHMPIPPKDSWNGLNGVSYTSPSRASTTSHMVGGGVDRPVPHSAPSHAHRPGTVLSLRARMQAHAHGQQTYNHISTPPTSAYKHHSIQTPESHTQHTAPAAAANHTIPNPTMVTPQRMSMAPRYGTPVSGGVNVRPPVSMTPLMSSPSSGGGGGGSGTVQRFLDVLRQTPRPIALGGTGGSYSQPTMHQHHQSIHSHHPPHSYPSQPSTTSFPPQQTQTTPTHVMIQPIPMVSPLGFRPRSSEPYFPPPSLPSPMAPPTSHLNLTQQSHSPPPTRRTTTHVSSNHPIMQSGSGVVHGSGRNDRTSSAAPHLTATPPSSDTLVFVDWWIEFHSPKIMFRRHIATSSSSSSTSSSSKDEFEEIDSESLARTFPSSDNNNNNHHSRHEYRNHVIIDDVYVPKSLKSYVPWIILKGYRTEIDPSTGVEMKFPTVSHSSAISRRYSPTEVETISGRIYILKGLPNSEKMKEYGWKKEIRLEWFEGKGFPKDWKRLLYVATIQQVRRELGIERENKMVEDDDDDDDDNRRSGKKKKKRQRSRTNEDDEDEDDDEVQQERQRRRSGGGRERSRRQRDDDGNDDDEKADDVSREEKSTRRKRRRDTDTSDADDGGDDGERDSSLTRRTSTRKSIRTVLYQPPSNTNNVVTKKKSSNFASTTATSSSSTRSQSVPAPKKRPTPPPPPPPAPTSSFWTVGVQKPTMVPIENDLSPPPSNNDKILSKQVKHSPKRKSSSQQPASKKRKVVVDSTDLTDDRFDFIGGSPSALSPSSPTPPPAPSLVVSRSGRKVQPVLKFWSLQGEEDDDGNHTKGYTMTPIKTKLNDSLTQSKKPPIVGRLSSGKRGSSSQPQPPLPPPPSTSPRRPVEWNQSELAQLLALHSHLDIRRSTFWYELASKLDRPGKDAQECARRWEEHFAPTPNKEKRSNQQSSKAQSEKKKTTKKKNVTTVDDDVDVDVDDPPPSPDRPTRTRLHKPTVRELIESAAAAASVSAPSMNLNDANNDDDENGDDLFDRPEHQELRQREKLTMEALQQQQQQYGDGGDGESDSKRPPSKKNNKKTKSNPADALQRSLIRALRPSSSSSSDLVDHEVSIVDDPFDIDLVGSTALSSSSAMLSQRPNREKTDTYVKAFQRSTATTAAKGPMHMKMMKLNGTKKSSTQSSHHQAPHLKALSLGHSQLTKQITRELRTIETRRTEQKERQDEEDEAEEGQRTTDHYMEE